MRGAFSSSSGFALALTASVCLVQVALGIVLFPVFQEYVRDELDAAEAAPGLLLAAYGATRFLIELPAGALADRLGRRTSLQIAYLTMLPALIAMPLFATIEAFFICSVALGVASAFLWPATYALAADLYAPATRGRVIGLLNLGQLIGFGLGALSGALLVERQPDLVFAIAVVAVAGALATTIRLPAATTVRAGHGHALPTRTSLREVASVRLTVLCGLILASCIGISMLVPLLGPFGEDELGISFAHLTLALAPAVVVGGVSYIPAGMMADRFGRMPMFVAGELLLFAGCLAVSVVTSWPLAMLLAVFVFLGNVVTVPAWNAAIMDIAPADRRGVVIGVSVAMSGLGLAVGPAIGGLTLGPWDAPVGLQVSAAISGLTAIGVALYWAVCSGRARRGQPSFTRAA